MNAQIQSRPQKVEHNPLYCGDPNCKSCNELRKVNQQMKTGKPLIADEKSSEQK